MSRSNAADADAQLNIRLLTNAISSVLAEQTPTVAAADSAIHFPTDDYDDVFGGGGTTQLDNRFATMNGAHMQSAQQDAERRMTTVDVGSSTARTETTTRRFIEGLPAADEDYEEIEGSSVDGDRIDPNLIKTLLG